jgi:uncharacterized protein HemX
MADQSNGYSDSTGGSSGGRSGVSWGGVILIAIAVVLAAWIGSAIYYEYRVNQGVESAQSSADAAAADAEADAAQAQQDRLDGLDARIQELEDQIDSLGEATPPAPEPAPETGGGEGTP